MLLLFTVNVSVKRVGLMISSLLKNPVEDGNVSCVLEFSRFLAGLGCSVVQVQAARAAARWSVKLGLEPGRWSTNKQTA